MILIRRASDNWCIHIERARDVENTPSSFQNVMKVIMIFNPPGIMVMVEAIDMNSPKLKMSTPAIMAEAQALQTGFPSQQLLRSRRAIS